MCGRLASFEILNRRRWRQLQGHPVRDAVGGGGVIATAPPTPAALARRGTAPAVAPLPPRRRAPPWSRPVPPPLPVGHPCRRLRCNRPSYPHAHPLFGCVWGAPLRWLLPLAATAALLRPHSRAAARP